MRSLLVVLVVSSMSCGAHGGAVTVMAGSRSDTPCVDRIVGRIRNAGYVETSVDRVLGFVRVDPLRNSWAFKHSVFFNIQCSTGGDVANVMAVDNKGPIDSERSIDSGTAKDLRKLVKALEQY